MIGAHLGPAVAAAITAAHAALPPARLDDVPEVYSHAWAIALPIEAGEEEVYFAWDLLRSDPHWADDKLGYVDLCDGETRMLAVFTRCATPRATTT